MNSEIAGLNGGQYFNKEKYSPRRKQKPIVHGYSNSSRFALPGQSSEK